MMSKFLFLLHSLVSAALGAQNACSPGNNCQKAVTGTARATPDLASRSALCSSFLLTTVILCPATSTVTNTGAPLSTSTIINTVTITTGTTTTTSLTTTLMSTLMRRDVGCTASTVTPSNVPAYASACADANAYRSACSCWGIPSSTTTSTPTALTSTSSTTPTLTSTTITTTYTTTNTFTNTFTSTSTSICPTPTARLFDDNNCGSCNNVCGAGTKCYNGICAVTCTSSSGCGLVPACGIGANCYCNAIAEGGIVCFDFTNNSCGQTCTKSTDCPAGSACVTDTCCPNPVCTPINTCANPGPQKYLFKKVPADTTIERPKHVPGDTK